MKKQTSPILLAGRWVFGLLAVGSLIAMFSVDPLEGGNPSGWGGAFILCAVIFGLTFVRRTF